MSNRNIRAKAYSRCFLDHKRAAKPIGNSEQLTDGTCFVGQFQNRPNIALHEKTRQLPLSMPVAQKTFKDVFLLSKAVLWFQMYQKYFENKIVAFQYKLFKIF